MLDLECFGHVRKTITVPGEVVKSGSSCSRMVQMAGSGSVSLQMSDRLFSLSWCYDKLKEALIKLTMNRFALARAPRANAKSN